MEAVDQYESIMDLDENIIVKLEESYYEGNIIIDDGLIAVCKFDMYLVEIDVSEKNKIDLSILFDLFEDEFSQVYDQLIEFYAQDDVVAIAEDIISSITHRKIQHHCNQYLKQLQSEGNFEENIEVLNQLLIDSKLKLEDIPQPKIECIYETTRSIFEYRNRIYPKPKYRFTIAKKILEYLKSDMEYGIKIELVHSNTKVRFQVITNMEETMPVISESRKMFPNGDSSMRVNFPPALFYNLVSLEYKNHIFSISLTDEDIIFTMGKID